MGDLCLVLVLPSFLIGIISLGKRELVVWQSVFAVPSVGLQCVIVAFPAHTHFFSILSSFAIISLGKRELVAFL